jgi:hypothetical protein
MEWFWLQEITMARALPKLMPAFTLSLPTDMLAASFPLQRKAKANHQGHEGNTKEGKEKQKPIPRAQRVYEG